ncbi:unnamed protein product [Larinioides sclopetarius]|uniref:PEP-utilising enzyme mobile domain-containing protein n=1 Tax=Larinioides sclopetarius TaxID=280406 RepID=A0AAV1ZJG1_9ARAC
MPHCLGSRSSSWPDAKAGQEINADVYTDFCQLLTTSSEVESADVPAAMEKLAFFIFKENKPEDFKGMKTEEALRWLETSPTTAGEKYRDFLMKHGHRCLRENLVGSITEEKIEKKHEDFDKLITGLKAPLTRINKLLLRFLLPWSRKAVQNRECSKSLLIRAINEWRKGYRKLSKLMVLEGRIPDEDILFFMTLEEIKELLETRSPRIISKANYRRRRQPIIDRYIFPEIIKGFPIPINAENKISVNTDENFSMKGLPVSRGVATGFVRVALDLEDASLLQPGEILVTYSTDIGWSPYFPILGGVVTELGGLISHDKEDFENLKTEILRLYTEAISSNVPDGVMLTAESGNILDLFKDLKNEFTLFRQDITSKVDGLSKLMSPSVTKVQTDLPLRHSASNQHQVILESEERSSDSTYATVARTASVSHGDQAKGIYATKDTDVNQSSSPLSINKGRAGGGVTEEGTPHPKIVLNGAGKKSGLQIVGKLPKRAVVSREYGLPCIAGLHGATQQFKTGDYVLLDGNKGILQKLPKPEDS